METLKIQVCETVVMSSYKEAVSYPVTLIAYPYFVHVSNPIEGTAQNCVRGPSFSFSNLFQATVR